MKRAILFVVCAAVCGAQTTVNGGRDYKGTLKASGSVSAVDFSSAAAPRHRPERARRARAADEGVRKDRSISRRTLRRGRICTSARSRGHRSLDANERQHGRRRRRSGRLHFIPHRRARPDSDHHWCNSWICHDGLDDCGLRQCFAAQCHQCHLCHQSYDLRCDDHVCQSAEQLLCGGQRRVGPQGPAGPQGARRRRHPVGPAGRCRSTPAVRLQGRPRSSAAERLRSGRWSARPVRRVIAR